MGGPDKSDKKGDGKGKEGVNPATRQAMTAVLDRFKDPTAADWCHGWVGMEPTFQSERSIGLWKELAAQEGGEDKYFEHEYMLSTERKLGKAIDDKYEEKRKDQKPYALFARVKRSEELDQWGVVRQCLEFRWDDEKLPKFNVRMSIDPETFEYSIKPVPLAWFYEDDFVRFLEEFCWEVPLKMGLVPTIAHGGAQFSISAKCFLGGSLLADDIATRLNHPELSTFIMDWPNPDDRPLRATRERFAAVRRVLETYWNGGFHPAVTGERLARHAILDEWWVPAAAPRPDLMDPQGGPVGDARQVFQTNFTFGRAFRFLGQNVHPGYWQSQHPKETGYRPDQIMRYSEINLNRMQIAGECHVKSGKTLDADRVPAFDAPLDLSMLYDEASWEDRGQMGRTSARDFTEALLLDVHYAQWLKAHPRVRVIDSLAQDQILGGAVETLRRYAPARLDELRREAERENLEASRGRVRSDWIEPETLLWESWKVLPAGEKVGIAREVVGGFVERVMAAASVDPRGKRIADDPMEWHRHRILPILWEVLDRPEAGLTAGDPVRRELEAWKAKRAEYLARRPVFSLAGLPEPWK